MKEYYWPIECPECHKHFQAKQMETEHCCPYCNACFSDNEEFEE